MSTPAVTVIMPTRNRAAITPRAIESVIAQTWSDWELIIIDDASTDATPDMIARYAEGDVRIRSLRVDSAGGAASARNRGIAAARGDYIAFIDDDDEWLAPKLERQIAAFTAAPTIGVTHGPFIEVDPESRERIVGEFQAPNGVALPTLLRGNQLGHSTVMVRRSVLQAAGAFDDRLPRLQDWDLWIRLAMITRFAHVPEPLVRVHLTPDSISTKSDALRSACGIVAASFERHAGLDQAQYAELCYALGQLLMRHGFARDGRKFVRRSLRLHPWPPSRIIGGLLFQLGQRPYHAVAGPCARLLAWGSGRKGTQSSPRLPETGTC
jgi:glycosyltransferase involved in cell wall biosynthesis